MIRFPVRRLLVCIALPCLAVHGQAAAPAGSLREPVALILPYPASGSAEVAGMPAFNKVLKTMQSHAVPPVTDLLARQLQLGMQDALGHVVLERRSRAHALEAVRHVARAAPDGHRLLLGGSDILPALLQARGAALPPATASLQPVAQVARMPMALVTYRGFAASDAHELIRLARSRPGRLDFASAGESSIGRMAGELFRQAAGIDITHVSFNGGTAALDGVARRQVDFGFVALAAALPFLGNDRLKLLGLAEREPYPGLPAAPLLSTAGLEGFAVSGWYGILAPRGATPATVERISAAAAIAVAAPQARRELVARGLLPLHLPAADFAAAVHAESARRARLERAVPPR